jgi:hypothetical protein
VNRIATCTYRKLMLRHYAKRTLFVNKFEVGLVEHIL